MKNYKAEITKIIQDQDMGYTISRFEPETVDKILSLFREIVKEATPNEMPKSANDGGVFEQEKRGFINGFNEARSEILSNVEKVIGGEKNEH